MIRRVAFRKAIIAGVAGAVAWEFTARVLHIGGANVFDIVKMLGTTAFGVDAGPALWWPAGMAFHCSVGAVWAIFYAFFFWSTFELKPVVQGILFSLLPAVLAGTIMVPQIDLMRNGHGGTSGAFAISLGYWGPAMILLGHLVFGVVVGSLYVRPVGYRAGKRIRIDV